MRVNELAREVGMSSKDLLAELRGMGLTVPNHACTLDDATVRAVRQKHPPVTAPAVKATPSAAPKTEPKQPSIKAAPAAEGPAPRPAAPPPARPIAAAPAPVPAPSASPAIAPSAPAETLPARAAAPVEPVAKPEPPTMAPLPVLTLRGAIIVKELAGKLGVRANQLIAKLMQKNVFATLNDRIEFSAAQDVARQFGFAVEHERKAVEHHPAPRRKDEEDAEGEQDRAEDLVPRPPVVTFLGHVDHGKTSLLDRIRDAAVAKGEAGGITQHIGAYTVELTGKRITFLDTPGHAAFTAMRARGANLTDIAVIIVAADDGVMVQTKEAIQHARAAQVAIMVAINKVDLPTADSDRVRRQLQAEGLSPEEWGGETICCEVSAQTGKGVDHLLEMILLQADMLELKANPNRRAHGYVIEARLEPGMGPTANLLVKSGSLKVGDVVLCGQHCGRVRALINDHGVQVKAAGPSTPVKCLGLPGVPEAGAAFRVFAKERAARALAEQAIERDKREQVQAPKKASLEELFTQLKDSEKLVLKLVVKADTQGSIEAIRHAFGEIKSEKVALDLVLDATGNITINDVMLASASNAVIMGFHVAKEPGVDAQARHEGVEIRLHSIIYEMIDEVREAMTGLLAPQYRETIMGRASVRKVFEISKGGRVAGCLVVQGNVSPRYRVRLKRGDAVVFQGNLSSLKHFAESVSEVKESQECGIRLEGFSDFADNDLLEFYTLEEVKQTL
jgi:translation initiation factor IF-2